MQKLVFIDWISPLNHRTFNQSFFDSIGVEKASYYVFDERLQIESQATIVSRDSNTRLQRARSVLKLIYKNRKSKIILITYDPIFIVFAKLFIRNLICIEHNTTPEYPRFLKHAIWQFLFLRRIKRLALFKEQVTVLTMLKQNCIYLGSPIPKYGLPDKKKKSIDAKYYLSPSYRSDLSEIRRIANIFSRTSLVVKITSSKFIENEIGDEINVSFRHFIDLDQERDKIKAIIISGATGVRLSGWINEGFGYGIPILAANRKIEAAIHTNFPSFKYIKASQIVEGDNPDELVNWVLQSSNTHAIYKNNEMVSERFKAALDI